MFLLLNSFVLLSVKGLPTKVFVTLTQALIYYALVEIQHCMQRLANLSTVSFLKVGPRFSSAQNWLSYSIGADLSSVISLAQKNQPNLTTCM